MKGLTPFQTLGPFFDFGLVIPDGGVVVLPAAPGRHVTIEGTVRDGAGELVPDALIEVWQADATGRYRRAEDPRGAIDPAFNGFGRVGTDDLGRFALTTIVPGRVPGPSGSLQAPHLAVGVLARGLITRLVTRMYFEDEPSNAEDEVLTLVPRERCATLLAKRTGTDRYQFDIVLQGPSETVFFDV